MYINYPLKGYFYPLKACFMKSVERIFSIRRKDIFETQNQQKDPLCTTVYEKAETDPMLFPL